MARKAKKKENSFENLGDFFEYLEEEIKIEKEFVKKSGYIPTNSVALNFYLGGGIPKNRLTELYGERSSGKTTIALEVVANSLKQDKTRGALFFDLEGSTDEEFALGIIGKENMDRFTIVRTGTIEEALTVGEEAINSGLFCIIVIDSISSTPTDDDISKGLLEPEQMAGIAKILTRFLKRNAVKLTTKGVTMIVLNQLRDNLKSRYGGKTRSGGNALDHFESVLIRFKPYYPSEEAKKMYSETMTVITDGYDRITGMITQFIIEKNKATVLSKGGSGIIPIKLGEGTYRAYDVMSFALRFGILETAGAWVKYTDKDTGEVISVGQGKEKALLFLESSEGKLVLDKIEKECYNLINDTVKEDDDDDLQENVEGGEDDSV